MPHTKADNATCLNVINQPNRRQMTWCLVKQWCPLCSFSSFLFSHEIIVAQDLNDFSTHFRRSLITINHYLIEIYATLWKMNINRKAYISFGNLLVTISLINLLTPDDIIQSSSRYNRATPLNTSVTILDWDKVKISLNFEFTFTNFSSCWLKLFLKNKLCLGLISRYGTRYKQKSDHRNNDREKVWRNKLI